MWTTYFTAKKDNNSVNFNFTYHNDSICLLEETNCNKVNYLFESFKEKGGTSKQFWSAVPTDTELTISPI